MAFPTSGVDGKPRLADNSYGGVSPDVASSHANEIITLSFYASQNGSLAAARAAKPNALILMYLEAHLDSTGSSSNWQAGVPWPTATANPAWFLKNGATSPPITSTPSTGMPAGAIDYGGFATTHWVADLGVTAYRDAWKANAITALNQAAVNTPGGFDGIFIDDASISRSMYGATAGTVANDVYATDAAWATAQTGFIGAACSAIRAALPGKLIFANMPVLPDIAIFPSNGASARRAAWNTALAILDGVYIENWCTTGSSSTATGTTNLAAREDDGTNSMYAGTHLNFLGDAMTANKYAICRIGTTNDSPETTNDRRRTRYALAMMMLKAKSGKAFFTNQAAFAGGQWSVEYANALSLGAASAAESGANGLHMRAFAGGKLIVYFQNGTVGSNTPDSTSSGAISLGASGSLSGLWTDASGLLGTALSSITFTGSCDAAFLVPDNPAPITTPPEAPSVLVTAGVTSVTLKANDTAPGFNFEVVGLNGTVDLTGAQSVRFLMGLPGQAAKVVRDLILLDPPSLGIGRHKWQVGDRDTPGTYRAEIEVVAADGGRTTYPENAWMTFNIEDNIF